MFKRCILAFALFLLFVSAGFAQAGLLRNYVGIINIKYHPDVTAYMGKIKEVFEKRGFSNAARAIDEYLKGLSGSGFVYVAEDGSCYVLTNEHVASQSESLSITFEKQDGSKTIYERLKVLFVDEEKDLALLVFDNGIKPFTEGLSFYTKPIDEGLDVFAAGFPGLGNMAVWQFSRGIISNVAARIPKESGNDETIGPYIQHTAQIDPGNSGSPLLVADEGVPTGYAVIGINTLSAFARQAANYAIPIEDVNSFIKTALEGNDVSDTDLIARKVDEFVNGLSVNKAVYGHIAKFLSNNCAAANAEFAISELFEKAPRTVLEDISHIFANDPVSGMTAAVAWQIENSMRSNTGSLKISLDSINPNYKGGFDVNFFVNDVLVKSEWIKEYGIFRMDTFGDSVTGDKSLVTNKEKRREQDKALRTDSNVSISAGYAYIFSQGSAMHIALRLFKPFTYGMDFYYAFETKYLHFGANFGYGYAIRMNKFALTPFGEIGFAVMTSSESKKDKEEDIWGYSDNIGFKFAVAGSIKGGFIFTTAAVPGLFGRVFYEHDFTFFKDKNGAIKNHGIVGAAIGYAF